MAARPVFTCAVPGEDVDVICLREAVLALCKVVLPHDELHALHHPAMTPLLCTVADQIGFGHRLRIFGQEADKAALRSSPRITWVPGGDSWVHDALSRQVPYAAAFIMGGDARMRSVVDNFRKAQPGVPVYFVGSTEGEAERLLAQQRGIDGHTRRMLAEDLVYDAVFRRLLPAVR